MLRVLMAEFNPIDWGNVIIQSIITIGVVFGGAGFWEFIKTKFQANREDKLSENASAHHITEMTKQITEMSTQMSTITKDIRDLKNDISLLQQANEATAKYREMRNKQDKQAATAQDAIIQSLMGILRERLVENYHRCMEKGYYTQEEREVYSKMYKCYTDDPFNGNGVVHQLQPKMVSLPWTEEEAKRLKAKKTIA